jgi:hypothetical protein
MSFRIDIQPQPDDLTCGPTCLHAVYRHYGDHVDLDRVIAEVTPLKTGGTLAVWLGCHALRRGYRARIYTYNLHMFDPTWFSEPAAGLPQRLREQASIKRDRKLRTETKAYLDFLDLGGEIRLEELRPRLLRRHLDRGEPILTGLSSTFLYRCAREAGDDDPRFDSVAGSPSGHFVVLHGYDPERREVRVADPYHENPEFRSHYYAVSVYRVIGAILLGVITYDANLLILSPPGRARTP